MNIALIGNNLANLVLSKILTKKGIKVSLYYYKNKFKISPTRTIAIGKSNVELLRETGLDPSKFSWSVKNIKIFNEKNKSKEIIDFYNDDEYLFLLVKNELFFNFLKKNLDKNKNFSKKIISDGYNLTQLLNSKYDLIINSEPNNYLSKKFFSKRIKKNYNSKAFTTIINHEKTNNKTAFQVFTKFGPMAFLPYSKNQTSIVFSYNKPNIKISESEIKNLILNYNKFYKINSFSVFEKFNLNFSTSKNYYHKNLLCFSDNLHKIHPLAGQGFNMTLRDIKNLSQIIDERLNLGLPLDSFVLKEFSNKTKHVNQIFSTGVDLIYELFKLENKINNNYGNKLIKYFTNNKFFKNQVPKFADKGLFF
tara:strand:- start:1574 stop:2665 length:1092 start_codon:yes stop_codon:yes gene_type:complete